jgi:signal transduction histidine kinase
MVRCTLLAVALLALARPVAADDVAPFSVFAADPSTFVVQRARREPGALEGFVVDRDALVATLQRRVLEEQGLGALARVAPAGKVTSGSRDYDSRFEVAYRYQHRFAAPFDGLVAQLSLAPLADDDGSSALLVPLTLALALAIVLGLYALYRMSAVQVRFAERRSNFVAAVSHELKTPLTAIRMYGEMLRDDLVESEDKRREYYATITAETERLGRLINNVLELSRLERDERPLQPVLGDLGQAVAEVVRTFSPHAERTGFQLALTVDEPLPAARFDRDALAQVLFNLLDNALKYGRRGADRRIQVRCRQSEGYVELSVEDLGPGVDDAQLDAIFEPFFRAQSELTREQPGTGIGLALVRGLVTRMGGSVAAHNLRPGFAVVVRLAR